MGALKKKKEAVLDKTWVGLLFGIAIPLIAFYSYYWIRFSDLAFFEYVQSMHAYRLLFKVMSLCVLTDLPVFYIFIQFKYWKGSRGVVMACFIFAFMVLGYRIFN